MISQGFDTGTLRSYFMVAANVRKRSLALCIAIRDAAMLYPLLWIDYQKQSAMRYFRYEKIKMSIINVWEGLLEILLFDLGVLSENSILHQSHL